MGDNDMNIEEQDMEAEALGAIFDTQFHIEKSDPPFVWRIELFPHATSDEDDMGETNWVGVSLRISIPLEYPEGDIIPDYMVEVIKGLTSEHAEELRQLAQEEGTANSGCPSGFSVCERLREWLVDHNEKGLDDISMHAQMLRRAAEEEKQRTRVAQEFESQKQETELSQAGLEELEVVKRRTEGTPCTLENFELWKAQFEAEQEELLLQQKLQQQSEKGGKKSNSPMIDKKAGRLTGFQQFQSGKMVEIDEALEDGSKLPPSEDDNDYEDEESTAVGEKMLAKGVVVDANLFNVEDDDLDDLDFDDVDDDDDVNI